MQYHQQNSDAQLIEGACKGNRLAQRYLYERYGGRMLAIPMRYTGNRDEAIEILNTAFLKIFDALPTYQPTGSLGGFMAKITFYTTIDFVRQKISHSKSIHYVENLPEQDTDNDALQSIAIEEMYAMIQMLPPATRAVFSLYAIDGYKHQEIATMLNISEGTSKWHLSEARKTLQTKIKHQNKVAERRPIW